MKSLTVIDVYGEDYEVSIPSSNFTVYQLKEEIEAAKGFSVLNQVLLLSDGSPLSNLKRINEYYPSDIKQGVFVFCFPIVEKQNDYVFQKILLKPEVLDRNMSSDLSLFDKALTTCENNISKLHYKMDMYIRNVSQNYDMSLEIAHKLRRREQYLDVAFLNLKSMIKRVNYTYQRITDNYARCRKDDTNILETLDDILDTLDNTKIDPIFNIRGNTLRGTLGPREEASRKSKLEILATYEKLNDHLQGAQKQLGEISKNPIKKLPKLQLTEIQETMKKINSEHLDHQVLLGYIEDDLKHLRETIGSQNSNGEMINHFVSRTDLFNGYVHSAIDLQGKLESIFHTLKNMDNEYSYKMSIILNQISAQVNFLDDIRDNCSRSGKIVENTNGRMAWFKYLKDLPLNYEISIEEIRRRRTWDRSLMDKLEIYAQELEAIVSAERDYRISWLKQNLNKINRKMFPGFNQVVPNPIIYVDDLDVQLPQIDNTSFVESKFKLLPDIKCSANGNVDEKMDNYGEYVMVLEQQNDSLEKSLATWGILRESYDEKISDLEQRLEQYEKREETLKQTTQGFEIIKKNQARALSEKDQKIEILTSQLMERAAHFQALEKSKNDEINDLTMSINQEKENHKELMEWVAALEESKNDEINDLTMSLNQDKEVLHIELRQSRLEKAEYQNLSRSLRSKLLEQEKQISNGSTEIRQMKKDNINLSRRITILQNELKEKDKQIFQLLEESKYHTQSNT